MNPTTRDKILEADNLERASDLELVEVKLRHNRDARLSVAANLMEKSQDGTLSTEDFRTFKSAIDDASKYHQQHQMLGELRRASLKTAAFIKSEPRTYGPAHPERSFFMDIAALRSPYAGAMEQQGAAERLKQHAKECAVESRDATKEGRRVQQAWRDGNRNADPAVNRDAAFDEELRAMSSGSTSGGALVTPEYLVEDWAAFRTPYRAFVDQCRAFPLPPYGMQINIPAFTSTAAAGSQTENTPVAETDPSGAYLTTQLATVTGQLTVSQQLNDRGGQPGLTFDMIAAAQLKEQVDQGVDNFVLTQALANAGTVSDSSAFSISNLYGDLAKAREAMQDAAGTRLKGTHAFFTSDLWGHVTGQVDSSQRPIIVPAFTAEPWASLVANGDPKGEGWAGHVLPDGLAVFQDNNVPAVGSNSQIVVARPSEVFVFEGSPISFSYAETEAADLSVVIGLRVYVGCIVRYAKAVQAISGNTYPTTLSLTTSQKGHHD
jgi:hypothetical protein